MRSRCQSDLERWRLQLSSRGEQSSRTYSAASQADIAMQLASTVHQLKTEPDGPDLYRLNDDANALMRMLPVSHSTRKAALREALTLPGRPGYCYFGRCAELPYVVEAVHALRAEQKDISNLQMQRAAESDTSEETAPPPVRRISLTTQLRVRQASGSARWCGAVRLAASRIEELREGILQARAQLAAEWQERLDKAVKRRKLDDPDVAPPRSLQADCRSSHRSGACLGVQDPLAYLSEGSSDA
mmetsp:Transcript_53105/g.119196  ORF Transcript_53105/g.119196 Transcript_53105/m.119196 type:complete len:244 (+) Transcript_53105:26-757(+)